MTGKALLSELALLMGLGLTIATLEWVAPEPSERYVCQATTARLEEFRDADHPQPPCFVP